MDGSSRLASSAKKHVGPLHHIRQVEIHRELPIRIHPQSNRVRPFVKCVVGQREQVVCVKESHCDVEEEDYERKQGKDGMFGQAIRLLWVAWMGRSGRWTGGEKPAPCGPDVVESFPTVECPLERRNRRGAGQFAVRRRCLCVVLQIVIVTISIHLRHLHLHHILLCRKSQN